MTYVQLAIGGLQSGDLVTVTICLKELPENVESKVHPLYSLFTILPSLIHHL